MNLATAPWPESNKANVEAMRRRHWSGIVQNPDTIVVKGEAYTVGPELTDKWEFRGNSGRKFMIRILATGEVITTTNLWNCGEVDPEYRDALPDNAEFIPLSPYPPFEPVEVVL